MERVINTLSSFDFFPKLPDELKVKASTGGAVTLIVGAIMIFLMISEVIAYSTYKVTSEVGVDTSFGHKLPINVDFGLDFIDHAGDQQLGVHDTLLKREEKEGCTIAGYLQTNKVAGEFHVAFGKVPVADEHGRNNHRHEFTEEELDNFNASHIINKITFGEVVPGISNPLDGITEIITKDTAQYQYFLKVVPTTYHHYDGTVTHTNQFSYSLRFYPVNTHAQQFRQPGIYFKYDIAPYRVTYRESHQSFSHFLTQLCAILGGLFTIAGILSSFILGAKKVASKNKLALSR